MAIRFGVHWRGGGKSVSRLASLRRRFPDIFMECLESEARDIMNESLRRAPEASGNLKQSWFVERKGKAVEIGYRARHAIYIHEGIRGGFIPPVEPFKIWAGIKFGDERLGFPIARAVGQRGLQPNRFLAEPVLAAQAGMDKRLVRCINRKIR